MLNDDTLTCNLSSATAPPPTMTGIIIIALKFILIIRGHEQVLALELVILVAVLVTSAQVIQGAVIVMLTATSSGTAVMISPIYARSKVPTDYVFLQ